MLSQMPNNKRHFYRYSYNFTCALTTQHFKALKQRTAQPDSTLWDFEFYFNPDRELRIQGNLNNTIGNIAGTSDNWNTLNQSADTMLTSSRGPMIVWHELSFSVCFFQAFLTLIGSESHFKRKAQARNPCLCLGMLSNKFSIQWFHSFASGEASICRNG